MTLVPGLPLYNQRLKMVAGPFNLNRLALMVSVGEEPWEAPVVTPNILEDAPQGGVRVVLGVNEKVGVKVSVEVPVLVMVGVIVGLLLGVWVGVIVGLLLGVRVMVTVGELVGLLLGVRVGVSVGVLEGVRVGESVGLLVGVVWDKAKAGMAKTNPKHNSVARRSDEVIRQFPLKDKYPNGFLGENLIKAVVSH